MSHVTSSCHWHMRGSPLLCRGWLSSPELHSIFCTIRTHTQTITVTPHGELIQYLKPVAGYGRFPTPPVTHKLHTNNPLHYGFGNISPLGFFIISSRQQQYTPISELRMPASVCCCAATQPCRSSLDGFNPKMSFEECCQTFTAAPKSMNCPSLPPLVAFYYFYLSCVFSSVE